MYQLRSIYGRVAYDAWMSTGDGVQRVEHDANLRDYREDALGPTKEPWEIRTYSDLIDVTSFLAVMNHRLELVFRGQRKDWGPVVPTLYRDTWSPPKWSDFPSVPIGNRRLYLQQLAAMGPQVYSICQSRGLPRWRTMRRVPEAQWSVIQHYELWPTPLVDVTRSLRVAATFAFGFTSDPDQPSAPTRRGHLYVIGLPNRTGSITYSLEDHLLAARLDSVCPPSARRPHLQEGLLVTRFPVDDVPGSIKHHDLRRRAVAHLHLVDDGHFWTKEFPPLSEDSLLPDEKDDPLAHDFREAFRYISRPHGVNWESR